MPVFDPRGSETILLVDDYQTLMQVTRRHLTALGYGVVAAPGVPSALAIRESGETVDLLSTDVVTLEARAVLNWPEQRGACGLA
jgi:CheY-like chemotaxis protein